MHAEMLKVNNHFSNFELQFELKLQSYIVRSSLKFGSIIKFSIGFTKHGIHCSCNTRKTISKIKV